jgi:hypothetical protein
MRLVENWKEAYKWFSVQLITVALIWTTLPQETQQHILVLVPDVVEPYIVAILLLAAVVGRVVDQKKVKEDA